MLFSRQVTSASFATPWTITCQAPLSMGFPRQEYWSGCCFLPQGIFLTQGANPCLLHWQVGSLPLSHEGGPVGAYASTNAWQSLTLRVMWEENL